MQRELIRDAILVALAQRFREDPSQFLTLAGVPLSRTIGHLQ